MMMLFRLWIAIFFLVSIGCAGRSDRVKERAQLHLQMGTAHLTQGNYPAALNELLQAEQLDKDNPVIQNNLGLAYGVRNRWKEAEQHYRRALELDSRFSDARTNLARLFI